MRVIFTIALLFCFAITQAQDQNLRGLLGMHELTCRYIDSLVQQKIIALKAEERQDSIPPLLDYWQANCETSEAMVRVQILSDFENQNPPHDLEALQPFFEDYLSNLRYYEDYSDFFSETNEYRLLAYTKAWADSLFNANAAHTPAQRFVLETLSRSSASEAENLPFTKKYSKLKAMPELQKSIRYPRGIYINWELGLLSYHYQGELSRYLNVSPALHAGFGASVNANFHFLLYGQVGVSSFKNDLRINEFDTSQFTRGSYSLSVGLQFSHTLINTANFDLLSLYSAGYKFLDTGLEEERVNSEGETYDQDLGLHSYDLALGLQADFRLYRYRHIGIRATYHFTDFNLGTRALDDLRGGYFALGLVLH